MPNPFTEATRLAYTLPERGRVRVVVFDVSGRELTVLADEVQAEGRHVAPWDGYDENGKAVPAGVYFARLMFGGRVEGQKIIVTR